jgi:hypothetical protein
MRAALAAVLTAIASASAAQQSSLDVLLERLGNYLVAYEPELSTLVADESLVQQTGVALFSRRTDIAPLQKRLLESDVMFMRLPGDGSWLGYRDVRRVDNQNVNRSGRSILELLENPTRDNQALAIELAWKSAAYNLGSARTINVPTLPLELMHPRNRRRFNFRLGRSERIDRRNTTRLHFEETVRPSLVQTPLGGGNMLSKGTVWVDPATGRLLRGAVSIRVVESGQAPFDWTIRVDFVEHRELGLLVPAGFEERFFVVTEQGGGKVQTGSGVSRARYSNFRRFTTSARIVPPNPPRCTYEDTEICPPKHRRH